MPEFLSNSNHFELGMQAVFHVCLVFHLVFTGSLEVFTSQSVQSNTLSLFTPQVKLMLLLLQLYKKGEIVMKMHQRINL